ncbi:hypothetical protein GCM10018966_033020 [Streptomyces yanii]
MASQILELTDEVVHPRIDTDDVLGHVPEPDTHRANDPIRGFQPAVEAVEPVRHPVEYRPELLERRTDSGQAALDANDPAVERGEPCPQILLRTQEDRYGRIERCRCREEAWRR